MNKEQPYELVKKALERRVEPDRREIKRESIDRRTTYDRSRENIMYASYPRSIIDSQLKALEKFK